MTSTQNHARKSHELVDLAKYTSDEYNVDVFVVERPTCYDKEKNDPEGLKQILSQTANGILMSLITPLKNVDLIKLPGLDNLTVKVRRNIFQHDGIHLIKNEQNYLRTKGF